MGIALKKFADLEYQGDFDLEGDEDDDDEGRPILARTIPDAVHRQATHSVRTGNRNYGGTVNYDGGLTDAGLQEYLRASQMWHSLTQIPRWDRLDPICQDRGSKFFRAAPGVDPI